MKQKIAKFILFVYDKHVKEDWNELSKIGKFFIYPAWFIKSILVWIISPIFIPQYLFLNSKLYNSFQQIQGMTPDQIREFNKNHTAEFIHRRYNKGKRNSYTSKN